MANMTRDELVTELKARGWNRFTDAQLQKYLDWALQEVYRRGQFPSFQDDSATGSFNPASTTNLSFQTLGGTADRIVSVQQVLFINDYGQAVPLTPATEEFWLEVMQGNNLTPVANGRVVGFPELYYVSDRFINFYPVPDKTYTYYVYSRERDNTFTTGASQSGLDETFDAVILAFAEMICNRRARDYDAMAIAESVAQSMLELEIANSNRVFEHEYPRVVGYRD